MANPLTPDALASLRTDFVANRAYRITQNAVTKVGILDVALDRDVVTGTDHSVSHLIDDWKVTNQQKSGRCWLFAGLNLLRVGAMSAMNVKDFEFSQNHIMFWDKLERANYYLNAIVETRDREVDDRTVAHLLGSVADDGGQWNMFVSLVGKHGLVPQSVMPETQSSSETARMNGILRKVLREGAMTLRELDGGDDVLDKARSEIVGVVHRILSVHLGTPPERFDWQWTDKDRKFHRDGMLTPVEFAARYATLPIEEYACLVHDPRATSPYGRTFTVDYLGNVVGGPAVTYLNVEMELLKRLAQEQLVGGEPVWFGCDVGQQMSLDLGLWDAALYDYGSIYDHEFAMGKADRLVYRESLMTHAMLFTGVDVIDGVPRRWRVENSWGDEKGVKGYWTMNDSWFDEYVFEIAVPRRLLPPELAERLDDDPIVLPAWDPMGSLA
ncbi:MAG: C1 family peptidase [Actinomycetota bacterium]|nr:C1 family peptidase [Actinomycetota bacterium]